MNAASIPALSRARAAYDASRAALEVVDERGTSLLTLPGPEADVLRAAVQRVMLDGTPQPITNRGGSRGVLQMLRTDGELSWGGNIATSPIDEARVGIRAMDGEGAIPIHYALLHPSAQVRDAGTGAYMLNFGQDGYGPVALVLNWDTTLARSTFTETDSGFTSRLYPFEAFGDAAAASLLRRAAGLDPVAAHNEARPIVDSGMLDQLRTSPSVELVRDMMETAPRTDIGTVGVPPVPEMQVYGGIRTSDVREIRLQEDAPQAAVEALTRAAEPHGIPVVATAMSTREGRHGWLNELAGPRADVAALVDSDWPAAAKLWRDPTSAA